MSAIFLSASIPVAGRGDYDKTADPFLIQLAVRELLMTALGRQQIIWGGHPSITPMIWAACEDLGISYSNAVTLYQSRYFEELYPEENRYFDNVHFIPGVENNLAASLKAMREAMFTENSFTSAVFIGGMEGILDEYELFTLNHPEATVVPVASPGGAARDLAVRLNMSSEYLTTLDFSRYFYTTLGIQPNALRNLAS